MWQYVLPALVSFLLTLVLIFAALRLFPKFGLMDRPHKYGLSRKPIPYYGGLTIFIGFLISVLLFVNIDVAVASFLIGAVIIVTVSFLDDMFGLSPWLRLFVQIFAALLLVAGGIGISVISNPLGEPVLLDKWILTVDGIYQISVMAALFTVVWVVAMINTMNFLDGLNGLPSGVAAIAALTLFLLSIRPGIHFDISSQVPVAMMSIILFGCALAFWIFDFYPAKILMGDTGSMFLGYAIAVLAIFSGGKIATAFLVMGFPILDAMWVILRRIFKGQSPMKGDRKHLHHRLLEVGLGDRKALLLIYGLCAGFGGIAVFLEGIQKVYAIGVLFILMFALGVVAVKYSK
jgi:UDP-GlcNAc:undecaprenyl-phosphate/decaprenyl-phosphate GlcNAc-1-phosphate transferase